MSVERRDRRGKKPKQTQTRIWPLKCIFCVYLGIDLTKFLSLCCSTQLLCHMTSPMMFHFGYTEITVLFYLICHYRKDKDDNGKPEAFQHLEKRTKYHYSILKDVSEESFISHLLWAGKHTLLLRKREGLGLQFLKKQAGELRACSPTKIHPDFSVYSLSTFSSIFLMK